MHRFLIPFSKTRDETPTKRQRLGEGSSLPPGVPALAEVHESVNADVSSSNGSPGSLGLMGNRNFPPPLCNPSVEQLKTRLQSLHANDSLHVAKIGQAYGDRAGARMTGNHYHGDWYARIQGQILAEGIVEDAHAVLLEQAGIDFMTQQNLCLNEQNAGLSRMSGQDGYSVSRTGVIYYMPLHPRLTREDYFHTLTGHKSYHLLTQGGGLKAQGIDKFSLKTDKHSLGTSKHAQGTSKSALGTSKHAQGTAKEVSPEGKQSRSAKGGGELCRHTHDNTS